MRTFFNVAIIATIIATVWFSGPIVAKQHTQLSVDPFSLTVSTTNVTASPQYDLF